MKKEAYFTLATLADKAAGMLTALDGLVRAQPTIFAPENSALLALDLQVFFLAEPSHAFIPSGPAILPGVNALMRAYAARDLPVFLTRHVNTPEDAGLMARWWRDLITEDDPLSKIDPRLERGNAIEIRKTRYDAFLDSPLEACLRQRDVRRVVVCGVTTHLCCETTARAAFMRGFEVFFTVDGTATYTEAFHRASLLNLAHGFATPVLVREVLAALEGGHG